MQFQEFFTYGLLLKFEGDYDKRLLLPCYLEGSSDTFRNPFSWLMEVFSYEDSFSYWSTKDSNLRIVFPSEIKGAHFEKIEDESIYHGVVCYPHMLDQLAEKSEELSFDFPSEF